MKLTIVRAKAKHMRGQLVAGASGAVYYVEQNGKLHLQRGKAVSSDPGVNPVDAAEFKLFPDDFRVQTEGKKLAPPAPKKEVEEEEEEEGEDVDFQGSEFPAYESMTAGEWRKWGEELELDFEEAHAKKDLVANIKIAFTEASA